MLPTVLVQTLRSIVETFEDVDWDYPIDVMQKISQELGWKLDVDHNSSGCGMCISVCGKYIIKHNYMSGRMNTHPAAIPTEVISSQEENRWGYYLFSLQPKADTSLSVRAYEELKEIYPKLPDGKPDNCAHWNGRAVLIDW